jgi:hypothetical protein
MRTSGTARSAEPGEESSSCLPAGPECRKVGILRGIPRSSCSVISPLCVIYPRQCRVMARECRIMAREYRKKNPHCGIHWASHPEKDRERSTLLSLRDPKDRKCRKMAPSCDRKRISRIIFCRESREEAPHCSKKPPLCAIFWRQCRNKEASRGTTKPSRVWVEGECGVRPGLQSRVGEGFLPRCCNRRARGQPSLLALSEPGPARTPAVPGLTARRGSPGRSGAPRRGRGSRGPCGRPWLSRRRPRRRSCSSSGPRPS